MWVMVGKFRGTVDLRQSARRAEFVRRSRPETMYLPEVFAIDDRATLLQHAAEHPFATVITLGPEGPSVSHLPLLVDAGRGVLRGHLARDNPQAAHFASGAQSLAIFHGPHGYVSPSVYEQPGVPTWNYVVVHMHGRGRRVGQDELWAIVNDTVERFDNSGWRAQTGDDFLRPMLEGIAGFEIDVERLEGKYKLSQNRSSADRSRVVDWLERGDDSSRALAALMRARL
jgi:transcriptional regulator